MLELINDFKHLHFLGKKQDINMILKKICVLAGAVLGLAFSTNLLAQEVPPPPPLMTILPESGQYLETQKFDIAINLSPLLNMPYPLTAPYYDPYSSSPYQAFYRLTASVNSADVSSWFNECIQEHKTTVTNDRVLLCKSLDYSPFTVGDNILKIAFTTPYQSYTAEAHYTLIKSQHVFHILPYKFFVQGISLNTASGISVALNDRVVINALGKVNTWPANPGFPLSTPTGTQVCAQTSTCLLPGTPVGALLVKIGPYGRWLVAGSRLVLTADRPGELIFAVNDKTELSDASDNLGYYEVNISKY